MLMSCINLAAPLENAVRGKCRFDRNFYLTEVCPVPLMMKIAFGGDYYERRRRTSVELVICCPLGHVCLFSV